MFTQWCLDNLCLCKSFLWTLHAAAEPCMQSDLSMGGGTTGHIFFLYFFSLYIPAYVWLSRLISAFPNPFRFGLLWNGLMQRFPLFKIYSRPSADHKRGHFSHLGSKSGLCKTYKSTCRKKNSIPYAGVINRRNSGRNADSRCSICTLGRLCNAWMFMNLVFMMFFWGYDWHAVAHAVS